MMLLIAAAVLALTPVPIDAAARAGLPRATAVLAVHGARHVCEGIWLRDLLGKAGASTGEALRGPALSMLVVATAADGYRVTFTLGELDASLGKAPVLVAEKCDAKPLAAADGPLRLVVEGEARGARSVRQLTGVVLLPLAD